MSPELAAALRASRGLARTIPGWLKARRRAADDRRALAGMSDRELLDIGVARASVNAIAAQRWTRELP